MKTIIVVTGFVLFVALCHTTSGFSDDVVRFTQFNDDIEESMSMCPNNRTKCNPKQTCCKTKHNSYHCCKYKNAVCCSDRYHCCPEGSTCDIKRKRCNNNADTMKITPFHLPQDPVEWKISKVQDTCPNNKTKCKDTQTCCVTKRGNYHCCKYQNAVCCSDKYHCCPEGSTCDLKRKRCNKNSVQVMLSLTKSRNHFQGPPKSKLWSVDDEPFCPNNKTQCKATKTCCITKHGNYYCCPHKNAVCCSDKYSCCPEGTTCDLKNKRCNNNDRSLMTPLKKSEDTLFAASDHMLPMADKPDEGRLEDEPFCPNNKSRCKATKTCCITKHGNYYCCPHKNAVCCSDKWSCCPEGTTCDLKNKKCINNAHLIKTIIDKGSELIEKKASFLEHFLTFFLNLERNCGNSKTACANNGKCCQMENKAFGCCKYKEGTCCPDMRNCCPSGTRCQDGGCVGI